MRARGATYEATSVLAVGARGATDGRPFTLVGRTCVQGRRGALWNEWSMRFDDGQAAFLAESRGEFTVYSEGSVTPAWSAIVCGAPLDTGYIVVDRGTATRVARWGETDEAPSSYDYADLSSRDGGRATIDFGSGPPRVFVGRRCTLEALSLPPCAEPPRLNAAPDVSRPKGVDLWLHIGDAGVFLGTRHRVVGVVSRSMSLRADEQGEQERAAWDEYLVYSASAGFRWLVVSDGHWSLVEPVEAGPILESDTEAVLDGDAYARSAEGLARVDWASGELPWHVAIGETSHVRDFVRGSSVLCKEWTSDDVAWSRGHWIAPDVIAKAFDKRALPKPKV